MASEERGLLERLRNRDHTRGSLLSSVLALSVPAILTSVGAFGTFQMVDLVFLGELGPTSLAAAGATNQTLRQIVFMLILGVSTSSQMLVARQIGAGRVDGAEHVAGQTVLIGATIAFVAGASGFLLAEPLIGLVSRDPEVIALGTAYIRVAFPFLFAQVFNQVIGGVLNGAGDTTTPMLVSIVVTPISLLGEWAFAFGNLGAPELGIRGIALGTGIGGTVSTLILFSVLFRGAARVHLRRRHLLPDPETLGRILSFSWQPALHMLARSTIVFFFMFLAGRLGGSVQAAYTIGLRIEMIPIMVAFPIANACATLVGQNLGAGDLPRAWRAIWVVFGVQASILWPLAVAIFLFRGAVVSVFTQDPEVHAIATEYLVYSSAMLVLSGFYFTAFRTLQAAGDMNSPMLISIGVALFVGVPLGWYLATQSDLGATGMWIANLTYTVVNGALMIGWLLRGRWARAHRVPVPPALD